MSRVWPQDPALKRYLASSENIDPVATSKTWQGYDFFPRRETKQVTRFLVRRPNLRVTVYD